MVILATARAKESHTKNASHIAGKEANFERGRHLVREFRFECLRRSKEKEALNISSGQRARERWSRITEILQGKRCWYFRQNVPVKTVTKANKETSESKGSIFVYTVQ